MRGKVIFILFILVVACIYATEYFGMKFLVADICVFLVYIFIRKVFQKRKIKLLVFFMLWTVAIICYTLFSLKTEFSKLHKYIGEECRVYGEVIEVCDKNNGYEKYVLKIDKITNKYGKNQENVSEKVNFWIDGKKPRNFKYGDYICTLAKVDSLTERNNRNDFDYKLYNYSERIYFDISAEAKDVKLYHSLEKVRNIYDIANNVRQYIKNVAFSKMKQENASLLVGILMSDKTYFSEEAYENMQKSGTIHIFAASGLHVSCISFIILALMALFRIPKKFAIFILTPVLIVFIFVNGCSASIVRAVIMNELYLISSLLRRDYDMQLSAAFAGVIIILINPLSAFDLGFILSFVSIFSIIFLYDKFLNTINKLTEKVKIRIRCRKITRNALEAVLNYIKKVVAVCSVTAVATSPICSHFFGRIPVYGILGNIFVSWILAYAMLSSFLMLGFSSLGALGNFFSKLTDLIFDYISLVINGVAKLPFSSLEIYMNIWCVLACAAILAGAYFYFNKKYKISCVAMAVCGILILGNSIGYLSTFISAKVCFVNVGQGDGCFVKFNGNEAVVIDGGGKPFADRNEFVQYMHKSGIKKVSYIFVSHFDSDHAKNVLGVMDEFDVSNVVLPFRAKNSQYRSRIMAKAKEKEINIINVWDGATFDVTKNIFARIYAPPKNIIFKEENDGSMALMLKMYGKEFFFLGDLGRGVQSAMASRYKNELECDVLKISHHGDYESYSDRLVSWATPDYALISCGKNNIYRHPSKKTVYALKRRGARVLCTEVHGDVVFDVNEFGIKCDSFLDGDVN